MLLHDKKVAILGAGPVGLTMARLLQQQGVAVTVYERDKDDAARIWGGTLDLHKQTGQEALKKAGLLQHYYNAALPMGISFADTLGKIVATRETTPQNRYDNPEINRNDLRQQLLDSVHASTVVWDSYCTGITAHNRQWILHFDNGEEAVADVVIGANGGMTKIRQYVTDALPEDSGTFIIQADVPLPEINCAGFYELCDGKRLMVAHGGTLLVANPHNNGALTYGVIFKTPEAWADGNVPDFQDVAAIRALLAERFSGWGEVYHELFNATPLFVGLPTRKLSLDKLWKTKRPLPITLIGDAAHVMPPFAGQGVNTGLMDALILSGNLTSDTFKTIEEAISDYERQMMVYATAAQQESAVNELEMRDPDFSFLKFFKEV